MLPMSGWRIAWVLGVLFTSFLAVSISVAAAHPGDASGRGGEAMLVFVLVVATIPAVVAVHEVGHAVAAVLVGYRVTDISMRPFEDGSVSWEPPPERESGARTTIALLGGSALALAATFVLLALPLDGSAAAWRAGIVTFSVLWHLDNLAPIERPGFDLQRDGFELARLRAQDRARRGRFGAGERAQLDAVDAATHAGDLDRARAACLHLLGLVGSDTPVLRAALLSRLALVDVLDGTPLLVIGEANLASTEAMALAPGDPLVVTVRAAVLRRAPLADRSAPTPPADRAPTPAEAALLALLS
jgi:hypothetical protein